MIDIVTSFKTTGEKKVTAIVDNLKKSAKQISSKKINVGFGTTGAQRGSFAAVRAEINARKEVTRMERQQAATEGQRRLSEMKKEQRENSKLVQTTRNVGEGLKELGRGAASLDPAAFLQSMLTAAGKATSAIPFLGAVAGAAAEVAGITVGAAGGALGAAKSSIANASEIRKRDFATSYYGGSLQRQKTPREIEAAKSEEKAFQIKLDAAKKADDTENARRAVLRETNKEAKKLRAIIDRPVDEMKIDAKGNISKRERARFEREMQAQSNAQMAFNKKYGDVNSVEKLAADRAATMAVSERGNWSPTEYANFVSAVSAGFGKIQPQLAKTLRDQFMTTDAQGRQANVEMATQVASGNWNALGTDEGAILQQISGSFSGALPSIRQAMQAELLKQYGGMVGKEGADVAVFRKQAGNFQAMSEQQEVNMANVALSKKNYEGLVNLQKELNNLQLGLINAASSLASTVAKAAAMVNGAMRL